MPPSGNLVDAITFSLPCDYGDAPDSYGTTAGSNGASHLIASTLALGARHRCRGHRLPKRQRRRR